MPPRRTIRRHPGGRRTGDSGTRDAVLSAARDSFARLGYTGTTIRAVAAEAGVDPALVVHFFGTKDALFAACLELPPNIAETVRTILAGPPESVGERLTRFYFDLWEQPATGRPLLAVFRSIAASEDAATMGHEFIGSHLIAGAAAGYDHDHPDQRVTLAEGQLVGVMFTRHIAKLEPIASTPLDDLIRQVAPSVQRYLTKPLPRE